MSSAFSRIGCSLDVLKDKIRRKDALDASNLQEFAADHSAVRSFENENHLRAGFMVDFDISHGFNSPSNVLLLLRQHRDDST
jgi:hypothetical protein